MKLFSSCFTGILAGYALSAAALIAAEPRVMFEQDDQGNMVWHCLVEAEDMNIKSGWEVIRGREGYFPAYPNMWSGNRLRAQVGAGPAVAEQEMEIPASGVYTLWIRHESSYGFDALFSVEIEQRRKTVFHADFGDREDRKYFTMGEGWRVQGPWSYHNTDYVYSSAEVELASGPALLRLRNGPDGKLPADRILDLFWLTSDTAMAPGNELRNRDERNAARLSAAAPIVTRCVTPVYFRIRIPNNAPGPVHARMYYSCWFPGVGQGPHRDYHFTHSGFRMRRIWERYKPRDERMEDENLPPGFDSGWQALELSSLFPAHMMMMVSGGPAELAISHSAIGRDAAKFKVEDGITRDIFVGTGNSIWEDEVLRGRSAVFFADFLAKFTKELNAYRVPGKRPYKFMVSAIGNASHFVRTRNWKNPGLPLEPFELFDEREFWKALGSSGLYFRCPPEYYLPENAERWGVNRSMGYPASMPQSAALQQDCYEGDYTRLRQVYERMRQRLEDDGLGDIPLNIKMIEERGPPPLATLRGWKGINERFREYAREQGLKPSELLRRDALHEALIEGKRSDKELWELVTLGDGSVQEAAENPVLFYHSKCFGSIIFADNCAEAVKLVEEIFPKGSLANWGACYPQDGHAVRRNWYDEFMLFRRRGMTSFGSEMSWGLCGTPYYIGPQSQSYEGTLARGLIKYHDAVPGPLHLLASATYGYNADYVETASYAVASHGITALTFYDVNFHVHQDICNAIKRFSFAIGAVEDMQTESKVVPSRVALGWSETTAIWDQAEPPYPGFRMPGNLMYQLERHYLYILLRHLQVPVDLLCDADIEAGLLKDYEVYFMVGDHITAKAAGALREWVEAGGVLVSVAGGGLRDEYSRPLDTLTDVYGIRGQRHYAEEQGEVFMPGLVFEPDPRDNVLEKHAQALRAKLDLIHAHPVDEISADGFYSGLPVLGYRQGFRAEAGTVLGTFRNGQTAVVMNEFGEGRALIMGFLPGIGYMYRAFPKVPYGRGGDDLSLYLYPDYKPDVREGLAHLLKQAWPEMGATVTASNPYVEANLLKQKDGTYHVALVNYSGEPIRTLDVRIRTADVGGAEGVNAAFGRARVRTDGDDLLVTVPLDRFEWLTIK